MLQEAHDISNKYTRRSKSYQALLETLLVLIHREQVLVSCACVNLGAVLDLKKKIVLLLLSLGPDVFSNEIRHFETFETKFLKILHSECSK